MIKAVLRGCYSWRKDSSLREVVKGASVALTINIIGSILGLAVNLIISNKFGAEGTGVYFLSLSIITITSTIGRIGFDNTIIRLIASNASEKNWAAVRSVNATALKIVGAVSLSVAIALIIGSTYLSEYVFQKSTLRIPILLSAIAVVPYSLSIVQAESLRGLKKIGASNTIKMVLITMGTMILIYPISLVVPFYGSILSYVIATIITCIVAWFLWEREYRDSAGDKYKQNSVKIQIALLLDSNWSFYSVAISGLIIQQGVIVILGIWGAVEDVGIYSSAYRVANLLLFPLFAIINVLMPKYAALHHQGDINSMAQLARNSSKFLSLIVVPVAVLVYLRAEWILAIFGDDFISGALILRILMAGVLVNVVTGSVAELLMMAGYGRITSYVNITGALIITVLGIVLIPICGGIGAAIAMSTGYIILNVLMVVMVRRFLGFWPVGLI